MRTVHSLVITSFTALLTLPAAAQAKPPHHAGTWWLARPEAYRYAFISGYKSGTHHAVGHDTPLTPFASSAVEDGVNKFYVDFRNRNIVIDEAIAYVARQLSGGDPKELNALLLKLRAAAAKAGVADTDNDD